MTNKKNPNELPPDALIDYDKDGVPISRKMENEALPEDQPRGDALISNRRQESENAQNSGLTGGRDRKKRQGT